MRTVLYSYLTLKAFPLIKTSSRLQSVPTTSAGGRGLMKVTGIIYQASKFDGKLSRILFNDRLMQNECTAWKQGLESRHPSSHDSHHRACSRALSSLTAPNILHSCLQCHRQRSHSNTPSYNTTHSQTKLAWISPGLSWIQLIIPKPPCQCIRRH